MHEAEALEALELLSFEPGIGRWHEVDDSHASSQKVKAPENMDVFALRVYLKDIKLKKTCVIADLIERPDWHLELDDGALQFIAFKSEAARYAFGDMLLEARGDAVRRSTPPGEILLLKGWIESEEPIPVATDECVLESHSGIVAEDGYETSKRSRMSFDEQRLDTRSESSEVRLYRIGQRWVHSDLGDPQGP